jgi:hypothetical protein
MIAGSGMATIPSGYANLTDYFSGSQEVRDTARWKATVLDTISSSSPMAK